MYDLSIDVYNIISKEDTAIHYNLTKNSNTVHVFMGKEDLQRYDVHYEYTGDVPNGAPAVPNILSYVEGAKVIGEVVKVGKQKKVIVYKYNAKKKYRKKQGHRQPYTKVEIKEIKVK